MTADTELLAAYRATEWTLHTPSGRYVVRPGELVPAGSIMLPAAVITAFNPRSVLRTTSQNLDSNVRLAAQLRDSDLEHHPASAHGVGADSEVWQEPGFLVSGLSLPEAVALGAAYAQNSILWIGEDRIPVLVSTRHGFAGSQAGDIL